MTLSAVSKNQDQVTPVAPDSSEQIPQASQKKPWQRMEGESLLWFNRFSLYMDLGYKRTLLAALHKEQEKAKVLKSTKPGQKAVKGGVAATKTPKGHRRDTEQSAKLAAVPQPKREQVPSSWKIAAQKWHWKERAAAWDEHVIDYGVGKQLERLLEGTAIGVNRVVHLKAFLKALLDSYNQNSGRMTFDQQISYFARMQSILRDIREEMKDYDEVVARLLLRQETWNEYKAMTPDMLSEHRAEQKKQTK